MNVNVNVVYSVGFHGVNDTDVLLILIALLYKGRCEILRDSPCFDHLTDLNIYFLVASFASLTALLFSMIPEWAVTHQRETLFSYN